MFGKDFYTLPLQILLAHPNPRIREKVEDLARELTRDQYGLSILDNNNLDERPRNYPQPS